MDARASNRHFLSPPSVPLLTGEGLCHVEFQGAPEDTQHWFVGSADIKDAFRQMRIRRWLYAFFGTALCSRIRRWLHREYGRPETSCFRFFDVSCSCNASDGFLLGDVFCQDVRSTARSREVLILLFSFVATTQHHRCSVANMARDSLASAGRMLTIL